MKRSAAIDDKLWQKPRLHYGPFLRDSFLQQFFIYCRAALLSSPGIGILVPGRGGPAAAMNEKTARKWFDHLGPLLDLDGEVLPGVGRESLGELDGEVGRRPGGELELAQEPDQHLGSIEVDLSLIHI